MHKEEEGSMISQDSNHGTLVFLKKEKACQYTEPQTENKGREQHRVQNSTLEA